MISGGWSLPKRAPVIAIDGPAGSGKSTVAKLLARELGLKYLDTGAMYRVAAFKTHRAGRAPEDGDSAAELVLETEIAFGEGDPQQVFMDGVDVTLAIRTGEIGEMASVVSTHSQVRSAMVQRQQAIVAQGGFILEGRDATTVIAPDADLKIYMTASLEERARRRKRDFEAQGTSADFEAVREQIEARDHRDITREDSPLRVSPDAHVIETACHSVDEVVSIIKELFFTSVLGKRP
jgi:cytidylate kinase